MQWFRAHPYLSSIAGVAMLILIGTFFVQQKTALAPVSSQVIAWGGGGAVTAVQNAQPVQTQTSAPAPSIMQQVQSSAPYAYVPPGTTIAPTAATQDGSTFDLNAFLAALSQPSSGAPASNANDGSLSNAYAFIPGGLVSTSSENITAKRSPTQQALYDYGNEVGSLIQSFETEHPNTTQVLLNQVQDRTNPQKIAAVESLGKAFAALGSALLAMDNVPPQAAADHAALAKSYRDIGAKLALVPQAQRDADFIAAIQTYNAAANTFTDNYVALADLFSANGVLFSQADPGSVFTFTPMSH